MGNDASEKQSLQGGIHRDKYTNIVNIILVRDYCAVEGRGGVGIEYDASEKWAVRALNAAGGGGGRLEGGTRWGRAVRI